jgi:hypothetical protein
MRFQNVKGIARLHEDQSDKGEAQRFYEKYGITIKDMCVTSPDFNK